MSPLFTQWIAMRSKRLEFDLQDRRRLADREDARVAEAVTTRRSAYARLNTAARQYAQELRAYLRLIPPSAVTDERRSALAVARQAFRDLYSDAQMILPDKILAAAVLVNDGLGQVYGTIRRVEEGGDDAPDRDARIKTAQDYCRGDLYDLIGAMRQAMREDLGVSDELSGPA
jgi:hypothetical protein